MAGDISAIRRAARTRRSKNEVDYGPGTRKEHCGICEHFEEPSSCRKVRGVIDPEYWCNLFEKADDGS